MLVSEVCQQAEPRDGTQRGLRLAEMSNTVGAPSLPGRGTLNPTMRLYTHHWQDGDLVMWDNRCLRHRALANYEMAKHRRTLRRTVVTAACRSKQRRYPRRRAYAMTTRNGDAVPPPGTDALLSTILKSAAIR